MHYLLLSLSASRVLLLHYLLLALSPSRLLLSLSASRRLLLLHYCLLLLRPLLLLGSTLRLLLFACLRHLGVTRCPCLSLS